MPERVLKLTNVAAARPQRKRRERMPQHMAAHPAAGEACCVDELSAAPRRPGVGEADAPHRTPVDAGNPGDPDGAPGDGPPRHRAADAVTPTRKTLLPGRQVGGDGVGHRRHQRDVAGPPALAAHPQGRRRVAEQPVKTRIGGLGKPQPAAEL